MKSASAIILCLFLYLFIACSKPEVGQVIQGIETIENDNGDGGSGTETETISINEQLRPYYDRFIEVMLSRGEDLRDIPIGIYLVSPDEQSEAYGYCGLGYSNYDNTGIARVIIVYTPFCWTTLTDIQKENLMFHEFGHALLERPHHPEPSSFPNGSPRSIMCSSNGGCSGFSNYRNYQDVQRDFYLDELLNEDIPMPGWATTKFFSTTLEEDSILDINHGWIPETIFPAGSTANPYSYSISDNQFTSTPYALAITAAANSQSNTSANWYKDFILSNFDSCSNLFASVNFKISNSLSNGFLNLYIDLYDDVDSDIEFDRHYAEAGLTDVGNGFYRIRTKAICIPNETVKFRIRLSMRSESNATVYFDDLRVDLYE
jgi:hypothetical protein